MLFDFFQSHHYKEDFGESQWIKASKTDEDNEEGYNKQKVKSKIMRLIKKIKNSISHFYLLIERNMLRHYINRY